MPFTARPTQPVRSKLPAPLTSNAPSVHQLRADNARLLRVIEALIFECWPLTSDADTERYMTSPIDPQSAALTQSEWAHVHALMIRERAAAAVAAA